MKKLISLSIIAMVIAAFGAVPALAYTVLDTAVTISASGTITGNTVAFSCVAVDQATSANQSNATDFASPSQTTVSDSGRALKITGGTNEVDARIIIFTENDLNSPVPAIDPLTGADGGGMVGNNNAGYCAAMFWGVKSVLDLDPNTNMNYVFGDPATPVEGGLGNCVYIVDKRHKATYCTKSSPIDNQAMYPASGPLTAVNQNTADDGLYPQWWDIDMRTAPSGGGSLIPEAQALYKNIATVAFNVGPGGSGDPDNYVCRVAKLTTLSGADNVNARLKKLVGSSGTDAYLYVYIGADFRGVPAQTYSTTKLTVVMVKG